MRRLLSILGCLMLVVSLGTTATAHALEGPGTCISDDAAGAEQVSQGHSAGDADEVPADGAKGYPHHHGGCHGDHLAAPIKLASATVTIEPRSVPTTPIETVRPRSTADPALRPPQA